MVKSVLIIKTGYSEFLEEEIDSRKVSLGDVLRTTPILHLFKDYYVTWITDEEAFPLLEGNPLIDRLLRFDWVTFEQLKKERFDVLINLEKVPGICVAADEIYSVRRYGFRFDPAKRKAEAYDEAIDVLAVSSSPKLKKINRKSAQELLFEMVGEKWNGEEYVLGYRPSNLEIYDVALNTQVGQKWPTKAWSKENWDKVEEMLIRDGFKVTRQDKQGQKVLKNLRGYIDWINSSKLLITNDSLGLHLALALKKKVIALFGSTPHIEIPFNNRGNAILPNPVPECLPCFKPNCEKGRNCIDDISPETVYNEVKLALVNNIKSGAISVNNDNLLSFSQYKNQIT